MKSLKSQVENCSRKQLRWKVQDLIWNQVEAYVLLETWDWLGSQIFAEIKEKKEND